MKHPIKTTGALVATSALLTACASLTSPFRDADPRWADYKSWTKVTEGQVGTGDPTGFLGNVHKGPEGYRDVYVNAIGEEALTGSAPYNYPVGTVVVKEQFDNRAAWEADENAARTVSIKTSGGDELSRDNWEWADSYKAEAGESAFCSGCHSIAAANDFVFTNGDFLAGEQ